MKYAALFSRYLGGIVFIFSGFVKGIDPVGSQIKFGDYMSAAGMTVPDNLLLSAAFLLCAAEFIIGVWLLTGTFYKAAVILYFAFMAVFTPLTLWLAIFNPVSDCGCFGDAIHLTNWETFFKNLVLIALGIILLLTVRKQSPGCFPIRSSLVTSFLLVAFTGFMLYNVRHLPVVDFRPYKTGTNILEGMAIPENAPRDEYLTTLIYEKDGVKEEFTLQNYPADDTTWQFVDQKSVLVKSGYDPPIKDFLISSTDGRDLTDYLLYDPGYSLLMISHSLLKARRENIDRGFMRGFSAPAQNISFYVVTSSPSSEIEKFQNGLQFCTADATLLKTIIRSNPGYLLLKDGIIVGKWSSADLPDEEAFGSDMTANAIRKGAASSSSLAIVIFIIIIALLYIAAKRIGCKLDVRNR
ncbi:MAG: DoxX family protein [Bacteroidales bacterium]|jgi:uncharacterized membrane protein YphA (DoxX/SURF4 family)|nr:DoxX family protein [Bacteroidales bacterium]